MRTVRQTDTPTHTHIPVVDKVADAEEKESNNYQGATKGKNMGTVIVLKLQTVMCIPNDVTQNYPFCRLKLVVETFEH